jgi:hypothetical protein
MSNDANSTTVTRLLEVIEEEVTDQANQTAVLLALIRILLQRSHSDHPPGHAQPIEEEGGCSCQLRMF